MGIWVIGFGGQAALYGVLSSFVLLGLARLFGRFPGWRALPFLVVTLSFVFLTQTPFPNPATMTCPVASAAPQLIPLHFMQSFWRLEHRDAAWVAFVANRTLAATAMNFLLCALIGLTLAHHVTRLRTAALFGGLLTLSIELTQLTAFWGLWPCPWRQFDVDDLLMNALGVIAGFALARFLHNRTRRP